MRIRKAAVLPVAALVIAACPPKEVEIEISPSGSATLISTCGTGVQQREQAAFNCANLQTTCTQANQPCVDQACAVLSQMCDAADNYELTRDDCDEFLADCERRVGNCPQLTRQICDEVSTGCNAVAVALAQVCAEPELERPLFGEMPQLLGARLVLVPQIGEPASAVSGCGQVSVQCGADEGVLASDCIATAVNDMLTTAIDEGGVGFDGLDEAENTLPLLLLYQGNDGDMSCGAEELFACASLGKRVPSAESFDIVCGSCQEGLKPNVVTPPCADECLLTYCQELALAL